MHLLVCHEFLWLSARLDRPTAASTAWYDSMVKCSTTRSTRSHRSSTIPRLWYYFRGKYKWAMLSLPSPAMRRSDCNQLVGATFQTQQYERNKGLRSLAVLHSSACLPQFRSFVRRAPDKDKNNLCSGKARFSLQPLPALIPFYLCRRPILISFPSKRAGGVLSLSSMVLCQSVRRAGSVRALFNFVS